MATVDRWLLPDGIEEVLPPEAARIEAARRQVLDLFHRWGYEFVVTPHIEYLESLLTGAGQDLDLRTFKVTDPASGRLMGFRADITPQVARMDAHSLRREGPSRLCYAGSVLHAQPRALSTSRSPIQLGAELYGDPSPASDVEVISLMLEMLEMAEVPDVHMDLGHVGIYRGLARAAGLSGEVEQQLFDALQRKAVDEVEALTADLPAELRGMLRALAELCAPRCAGAGSCPSGGGAGRCPGGAERADRDRRFAGWTFPRLAAVFRPRRAAWLSLSHRRGVCGLRARRWPVHRPGRSL